MKNKLLESPRVFDFINIQDFLTSYYQYRKSKERQFSYEIWAREAGIKSRSLLRMVVLGKRSLTLKMAEILSYQFSFQPDELKYFLLLVEYSAAKSKEQRNFIWKKMLPLVQQQQAQQVIDEPDFLSSHWLPKIQLLLSFSDIEKTTQVISKILGIELQQTEVFMKALEQLKLVKKVENSVSGATWNSHVGRFKIPESSQKAQLKNFYVQAFQDAEKAIALKPEIRKFRSLLVPLSTNEYAEVLLQLEEAFQEILLKYKSDELNGRRLYQMTTSLVPLTALS